MLEKGIILECLVIKLKLFALHISYEMYQIYTQVLKQSKNMHQNCLAR